MCHLRAKILVGRKLGRITNPGVIKAVANEDTLLLVMFLGRANGKSFVADTKCS